MDVLHSPRASPSKQDDRGLPGEAAPFFRRNDEGPGRKQETPRDGAEGVRKLWVAVASTANRRRTAAILPQLRELAEGVPGSADTKQTWTQKRVRDVDAKTPRSAGGSVGRLPLAVSTTDEQQPKSCKQSRERA